MNSISKKVSGKKKYFRSILFLLLLSTSLFALKMEMLNCENEYSVDYPLALFYGKIDIDADNVTVNGTSFPVYLKYFKAVVKLNLGKNTLTFDFGNGQTSDFTIYYHKKTGSKTVKICYYIASDGDGSFEAGAGITDNKLEDAITRLKTAALVMQTFYSEGGQRSRQNILGGKQEKVTFNLELDPNLEPIINVIKIDKTQKELMAMKASQAYNYCHDFARKKKLGGNINDYKLVSIAGWSGKQHMQEQMASGEGFAWGGGSLTGSGYGCTTSGTFYSWSPSIKKLTEAFSNKKTPESNLGRDWGMSTYYGNYGVTLGGWCHEAGHGFGKGPHDATGLMGSDGAKIYKMFLIKDPGNGSLITIDKELPAGWFHEACFVLWTGPFLTRNIVVQTQNYIINPFSSLSVVTTDNNYIQLILAAGKPYSLNIVTVNGRSVYQLQGAAASDATLQLSDPVKQLIPGVYIIQLEQSAQEAVTKWIHK